MIDMSDDTKIANLVHRDVLHTIKNILVPPLFIPVIKKIDGFEPF